MTKCTWCTDPNADGWDPNFCKLHEAEYLGTSVAGLDHMYQEQAKDEFWAHN